MWQRTKLLALGAMTAGFTLAGLGAQVLGQEGSIKLKSATLKLDPDKANAMKRQIMYFGANHLKV